MLDFSGTPIEANFHREGVGDIILKFRYRADGVLHVVAIAKNAHRSAGRLFVTLAVKRSTVYVELSVVIDYAGGGTVVPRDITIGTRSTTITARVIQDGRKQCVIRELSIPIQPSLGFVIEILPLTDRVR